MSYVDGFLAPVHSDQETYRAFAAKAAPIFREHGATRVVECWGDDIPDGTLTDFRRAVAAEAGETVVFSWIEYPDRATADATNQKLMEDLRMQDMGEMPFDGMRMIYAGFEPLLDDGGKARGGYMDGFVVPVPEGNKEAYRAMAQKGSEVFQEYGALRVVEAWGDNVTDGKVTDFKRATQAKDGETVVFSFIEWPDKGTRDKAWEKVMADPRMQPDKDNMPFDGQRMFWGGFMPVVDG